MMVGVCGPVGLGDQVVKSVGAVDPQLRDQVGGVEIHEEYVELVVEIIVDLLMMGLLIGSLAGRPSLIGLVLAVVRCGFGF